MNRTFAIITAAAVAGALVLRPDAVSILIGAAMKLFTGVIRLAGPDR